MIQADRPVYRQPNDGLLMTRWFTSGRAGFTNDRVRLLAVKQVYWLTRRDLFAIRRFIDGQVSLLAVKRGFTRVRWVYWRLDWRLDGCTSDRAGLLTTRQVYWRPDEGLPVV